MEVNSSREITNEDLALFEDALNGPSCDNLEIKIYSIKRVASLAKALGPQKTRQELIDVLASAIDNLEDEVLFVLLEELELFLPLVGGPEYSYELLSMLLKISRAVDEPLVRNRAIETIKKLLADIDQQLTEKYLVSSIVEIDDNVWFSEKCSTLSLIPICYSKASPQNKMLLRQKYCEIFNDNSALIRKLAAVGLLEFINIVEIEHVLKEFIPILHQIMEDNQDAVRVLASEVALVIGNKSKNQEVRSNMLEIIREQSKNKSWKIRQRVASLFDKIAKVFEEEEFISSLLDIYESLINDAEVEVRVGAVQSIYNFAEDIYNNIRSSTNSSLNFDKFFSESYLPIILPLITDDSDDVQITLSAKIMSLGRILSSDCFKKCVLPIIIDGLESEKPMKFKENILMNLDLLPTDVDLIKSLSSINDLIKNILVTSETSWRTRRSLLVTFLHVSKFCTEQFFKDNLLGYFIMLLKDNIYAVRRTATLILPLLVKKFGVKWLIKEIMPQIHAFLKNEKYLLRYIILFCVQELLYPSINVNSIENHDEKFLSNLKNLINTNDTKYGRTLCKITMLNAKLRGTLKEKPFDEIVGTYSDDYNISGENIRIYSEDLIDTMTKNYVDIFSIPKNDEMPEMCYLEGIMILLNKEIIILLKILVKDSTINIQDRAKYTINQINRFAEDLHKELQSSWVQDYITKIDDSQWNEINSEIKLQIEEAEANCTGAPNVNTNLIAPPSEQPSHISLEPKNEIFEVFPKDCPQFDEPHIDQMESVDEEKPKDSEA